MSDAVPDLESKISRSVSALWQLPQAQRCFDVIIVGSGYGGSVAAEVLSRCEVLGDEGAPRKLTVCVLERGREYLPGQFPSTMGELPGHTRVAMQTSGQIKGAHDGLFDLRAGPDVTALVANGLGGGSLINGGVLIKPRLRDFEQNSLPRALVSSLQSGGYFDRAMCALGGSLPGGGSNDINRHPDVRANGALPKTRAIHAASAGQSAIVPISVAMDDRPNSAGVQLKPCELCGDCMTGCNVGAKDSLDASLLEQAYRQGADIYTGASVLSLRHQRPDEGDPDDWVLRVVHTDPGLQAKEVDVLPLHARHVILAAGTLGSTEILMRSRDEALTFSSCLGEGYSSNGDNITAVYGMPASTKSSVDELAPIHGRRIGPTITASATLNPGLGLKPFLVQEFAIPGAFRRVLEEVLTTTACIADLPRQDMSRHGHEAATDKDPFAVDQALIDRSLVVGIIGHDDASGALYLPDPLRPDLYPPQQGTLAIRWPDGKWGAQLDAAQATLEGLVQADPQTRLPRVLTNPMWKLLPDKLSNLLTQGRGSVVTVHPLGGCRMDRKLGSRVVDSTGRVFNPSAHGDTRFHAGLVVLDGSIMPGSLGVNPALTITATAMRAMDRLVRRWEFAVTPVSLPLPPKPRRMSLRAPQDPKPQGGPTVVEVIERLSGPVDLVPGLGQSDRYVAELTVGFAPFPVLSLTDGMRRELVVSKANDTSRIRLYPAHAWDDIRVLPEPLRAAQAVFDAPIEGRLRLLHREPSCAPQRITRSALAWLRNRGLRDVWQAWQDDKLPDDMLTATKDFFKLATKAGEVRRFDYELSVGAPLKDCLPRSCLSREALLKQGSRIRAEKRFTYNRRANPWHQVMKVRLTELGAFGLMPDACLRLDAGFLADRGQPLVRIVRQDNHARGLADLASFLLYFARLSLSTHLWTFRKPDAAAPREPDRLPGPVAGLMPPEIYELVVDKVRQADIPKSFSGARFNTGDPVKIRLTRYRPMGSQRQQLPPLAMIHGYSVSGNTYTHPSLKVSAAEFFCSQGRDVWVIDLRTSTGLPTAHYPWSMEQVALIDLPAALLHIKQITGQRVDVLAHCIGAAMLSMAVLSDAQDIASNKQVLGVDTWLKSEHLGMLMAFNGRVADGNPRRHPCINRIVLSQKGPLLRYTDENIFRAFVLQTMRRWLVFDDFQFRPPQRATLFDEVLDSFLSSVPYPDEDYDVENPIWPWARTPWTGTRHRMDAVYGRDFDAGNLTQETLLAIDDLFGPINLDTVSQVIHFTRFQCITNQSGRGEFVTRRRLYERWSEIPTMAIHGKNNGLVDAATQNMIRRELAEAGVPIDAPSVDKEPYRSLGHQDCMIGQQAVQVFEDIERFLRTPEVQIKKTAKLPPELVLVAPWVGPRLNNALGVGGALDIACMSPPHMGKCTVWLIPVSRRVVGTAPVFNAVGQAQSVIVGQTGVNGKWLHVTPPVGVPPVSTGEQFGYLVVLAVNRDEMVNVGDPAAGPVDDTYASWSREAVLLRHTAWVHLLNCLAGPLMATAGPVATAVAVNASLTGLLAAVNLASPRQLDKCFLPASALERIRNKLAQPVGNAQDLKFVLASCQYPATLLEPGLAARSLSRLADLAVSDTPPDLALFVGDQIYADATAGLVDPTRKDELFDVPYERALRVPAMQRVFRHMRVQTMLDDHEIENGWETRSAVVWARRPEDTEAHNRRRDYGVKAWRHWQQMLPNNAKNWVGDQGYDFTHGGHPFFMVDTRSVRSARPAGAKCDDMLGASQWRRLCVWLNRHKTRLKFVATPAALLPRRRDALSEPGSASRGDGWCAYPQSLHSLLRYMLDSGVEHTVFLSGDEHHSFVVEATVSCSTSGRSMRVVSVHSSGLYSPVPFVNGVPSELVRHDKWHLMGLDIVSTCIFAEPGDGFVSVQVGHGAKPQLQICFEKADGQTERLAPVTL